MIHTTERAEQKTLNTICNYVNAQSSSITRDMIKETFLWSTIVNRKLMFNNPWLRVVNETI